jgi:CRISPR-associated protein Cas8a1/Csx13
MAKAVKPPPAPPPNQLVMKLFAPGMSAVHRAGLGGLACTLKAMERLYDNRLLSADKVPGPVVQGTYPWEIADDQIILHFGKPDYAGNYLRRLFEFAFQIRDGVIYLPGQYPDPPPTLAIRAALQDGMQNTFLQHGPTCGSRSGERVVTTLFEDVYVTVQHDVFTSYKHQGWFWLDRDEKTNSVDGKAGKKVKTGQRIKLSQSFPAVTNDKFISGKRHDIDNKLVPGGMVRHDRFKASALTESDAGLICLHFAIVGCLTLSVNQVTAVLLVPNVENLCEFAEQRRWLTPQTIRECKIAGAADAALQSHVRVRARQPSMDMELPSCVAMTCRPTKWNKKQKPRVHSLIVNNDVGCAIDQFERALALLPPRLIVPMSSNKLGTRRKAKSQSDTPYWIDSTVRPLIATNLADERKWYDRFCLLFKDQKAAKSTSYETGGLRAMAQDVCLTDADERAFIAAMHRAIYMGRGRIYAEAMGEQTDRAFQPASRATIKRWEKFMERLRLGLVGAKTASQTQAVITSLLARQGTVKELRDRESVQQVRQIVFGKDWQRAKNLALFSLASYVRPPQAVAIPGDPEDASTEVRSATALEE